MIKLENFLDDNWSKSTILNYNLTHSLKYGSVRHFLGIHLDALTYKIGQEILESSIPDGKNLHDQFQDLLTKNWKVNPKKYYLKYLQNLIYNREIYLDENPSFITHLLKFPHEILLNIADFLPLKDYINFGCCVVLNKVLLYTPKKSAIIKRGFDHLFKKNETVIKDFIKFTQLYGHQLDELKFINSRFSLTDPILTQMINNCHYLKHLKIIRAKSITDTALAYLQYLPLLESLDLTYCSHLTNEGLMYLNPLKKLKFLNLSYFISLNSIGLKHMQGLTTLTSLDLSNSRFYDADLVYLQVFTQLKILNLTGTFLIGKNLTALKPLILLQELNLSFCFKLQDEYLIHIQNLKSLKILILVCCVALRATGIRHLKSLALEKLDLSCTHLAHESIFSKTCFDS